MSPTETQLHPDMTMTELIGRLPGAQRALFRLYHIGGCASCGFNGDETVAEVCARNDGLNPGEVLTAVESACAEEARMLINVSEASDRLLRAEAEFLDIRTREEFDAVHIPGSHHFTQESMAGVMAAWPKETVIVVVDHKGARALDAASYFAGHGFTNVRALDGGIDRWSVEIDASLPRYTVE